MGTESMIPHADRPLELGLCRTPADVADSLRRAAARYRTDADGIYGGPAWERVAAALDGAAEALEPIDPAAIRWDGHARAPVALVLLDFHVNGAGGTTIVRRDADGSLHGCRDVSPGNGHDQCVAAWIKCELDKGLRIDDRRTVRPGVPS